MAAGHGRTRRRIMRNMSDHNNPKIGIIGGSGLDDPQLLDNFSETEMDTPWGKTSDKIKTGKIGGIEVAVMGRHARGHGIMPTLIPNRANIWAMKELGCTAILATTACGSLREEIRPGDIVLPDQFIDFTKLRNLSFFEDRVVHTAMPDPFDKNLRKKLVHSAREMGLKHHTDGTIVTIEGPRFSTRAESKMFRNWGADLINMSTVPEVVLANEMQIPYQTIAMVTDYDSWRISAEPVNYEMVIKKMEENADRVLKLLTLTILNFNK